MNDVVYIGNSVYTAEALLQNKEINLIAVVYQKGKVQDSRLRLLLSCDCVGVETKKELSDVLKQYYCKMDFAVMHNFGIILPAEIMQETEVYNFHLGDLRNNRGSSPINWSVLLNHRATKMTLHRVCEEIDLGEVISEHNCTVYEHDVPSALRARLDGEIPSMLLELIEYREGKRKSVEITQGIYRPRICETDYTILTEDSEDTICAKIRSQYDYNGAIVMKNGQKQFVRSFADYRMMIK